MAGRVDVGAGVHVGLQHQRALAVARVGGDMERGDLTQRVRITPGDEVGELATAFNSMAGSLARNEQLRKNMVTDVAHEMRTPLSNIRGYLEAMRDGVLTPDEKTLDSAYEEAIHLSRLVDDLQELAEGSTPVEIDPDRVGQVLQNLLSNALAHTPEGGAVRVAVERVPGQPSAGNWWWPNRPRHRHPRRARSAAVGGPSLPSSRSARPWPRRCWSRRRRSPQPRSPRGRCPR